MSELWKTPLCIVLVGGMAAINIYAFQHYPLYQAIFYISLLVGIMLFKLHTALMNGFTRLDTCIVCDRKLPINDLCSLLHQVIRRHKPMSKRKLWHNMGLHLDVSNPSIYDSISLREGTNYQVYAEYLFKEGVVLTNIDEENDLYAWIAFYQKNMKRAK